MAVFKVITEVSTTYKAYGITKKYHDDNAIFDLIRYIFDPRKTNGKYIGGFALNPLWAAEQMTVVADAYGKSKGRRIRHMILSFEETEQVTPEQAMVIAYQAGSWYAKDYQIVYAVHVGSDHLHIHFVMNMVSYMNGKKYRGEVDDFYKFQSYLREILRDYGLALEVKLDGK